MAFALLFQPGPRLIDGDDLNDAFAYPRASYEGNITAGAASDVDTSPEITETISQIDTVATAADGVSLPQASPGRMFLLINDGANSMTVFAKGGSTINGTAGATGVALANAKRALYFCAKLDEWFSILTA